MNLNKNREGVIQPMVSNSLAARTTSTTYYFSATTHFLLININKIIDVSKLSIIYLRIIYVDTKKPVGMATDK